MDRPKPPSPERILIIRPSALGDVCRTVPVMVSLRRRYPDAQINWLVQAEFADAVEAHPDLSAVVPFDRRGMKLGTFFGRSGWRALRGLVDTIRGAKYDLVLDCQGLARSGFFAWVSRAPHRIGYANAEELANLGYTHRVDAPRTWHTVDRMLTLVGALGVIPVRDMRLYTPEHGRDEFPKELEGKRYAVIAPTSRWPGKRWPADRFAQVADALLKEHAVEAVAVVASESERDQCAPVLARDGGGIVDLVGKTTVGGLMGVIERSAIVIANDSAALHMAVGFDRPMVGIFGPTRIDLVGPYARDGDGIQADIPEPGDTHKDPSAVELMKRVSADRVIQAALQRLRAPGDTMDASSPHGTTESASSQRITAQSPAPGTGQDTGARGSKQPR